jgi:hypothetical protein
VVRPSCEWVLAGEGVATEKFDGTACAVIAGRLYKRRDLSDKSAAATDLTGWVEVERYHNKDAAIYWVPVGAGPDDRWHREAWAEAHKERHKWVMGGEGSLVWQDMKTGELGANDPIDDGTYELVGPKVQGNPYDLMEHQLWRHGSKTLLNVADPHALVYTRFSLPDGIEVAPEATPFEAIDTLLKWMNIEGIVWHHPDGRMVKIKRRDFGLPWPIQRKRQDQRSTGDRA